MKKILLLLCFITSFLTSAQNASKKEDHQKNRPVREIRISKELAGDLYQTVKSETVILLIPGSGPTDRDGNTLGITENNSLKFLAEDLSKQKYNVFTYDKRVVNLLKEKKELPDLDFKHGIQDAITVIKFLKEKLKYKNVVVAGHSEGSLVGMMAAQFQCSAFISLAGAGNTIDIILAEQLRKQAPTLNNEVSRILKELKEGKKVTDVNPMLQGLFGEQNQTFLIEWISLNPVKEIAKLRIPVLIINGESDIQVSVREAQILHKANPKSEVAIIKNMNHIFKTVTDEKDNMNSYNDPKRPINEELVPIITNFLRKNKL